MIDLHAHILPGIDDGAQDIAASLAMAQCYLANGFKRVVATPHSPPEMVGAGTARRIAHEAVRLSERLRANSLPLAVDVGMEIVMAPEVPGLLNAGLMLPLAGSRYVLSRRRSCGCQ